MIHDLQRFTKLCIDYSDVLSNTHIHCGLSSLGTFRDIAFADVQTLTENQPQDNGETESADSKSNLR